MTTPIRKIALEEHFGATEPDIVEQSETHFTPQEWPRHRAMLLDIHDERLALMDECAIEKSVLSLLSPGIQSLHDAPRAVDWARRLNDYAAARVAERPDRFAAFAALPMQDPDAATAELRRAVQDLGLVGALVNGFSQVGDAETVVYLDDPRYAGFWATLEELGVPLYLHPRDPLESTSPQYDGHPWLYGSAWAFTVETATHALRLMGSGLFDRHPGLQVILGHLGEVLPWVIWRVEHRLAVAPRGLDVRHGFGHYLRTNFHVTTSGNFRTPALLNTLQEIGADRVLFSADHPFEDMREAATWFDRLELNDADLARIAHGNAERLLGL
ncbi:MULTISPECIES: amidohydrolase family protein [unclassified Pseudonocardia]|uniref:amidohydrolase family protein n=1 Tax=unclassified Pseudonocardia TaxID=2619320 RepID=UPI00094AF52E|nr:MULTISPECIES: amidohydrolase family protein [unclassified Pseudonocardia]OLM34304.1 2-amino-3-carboxymuconate-6-semialdehyde decarboxylase [Pseudonocardia sp. Ae717_Ps2]